MSKTKLILLTFTIKQIEKLLKYLYIACDKVGVKWREDKELKGLIKTLQAEYYNKTGKWWIS